MLKKEGVLAGVVALFLGLAIAPGAQADSFLAADEAKSRALVNSARAAVGLGTLASHAGLDQMARAQAARMASKDAIYHNPNLASDTDAAGIDWGALGENVGVGGDVASIHAAFMKSPLHHKNIVYPTLNAIGVGVVAGNEGRIFVAHVFAQVAAAAPPPASAAPSPPSPVAPSPPAAAAPPAFATATPPAAAPSRGRAAAAQRPPAPPRSPRPNALVGGAVDSASDDSLLWELASRPRSPSVLVRAAELLGRLADMLV